MYVEFLPSKIKSHADCVLLREGNWENGKCVKKTIANISDWDRNQIEALRLVLKGNTSVGTSSFKIIRSLPHGAVLAVLGIMNRLGFPGILASKPSGMRSVLMGLIVERLLSPGSKITAFEELRPSTATSTLHEELGLETITSHHVYEAMDFLFKHKGAIEKRLAKKHLSQKCLVLYDLTSVYFEGVTCPLTFLGHSKDKKGSLQIMVGLLTNKDGIPISTEVFEGNILDHQTLMFQINKIRKKFGVTDVIMVGDRGTIIQKRIKDMKKIEDLSFITALGSRSIKALVKNETMPLSLFDQTDLAEITSPLYPGERLVCCKNPYLAQERTQTRESLLSATEKELEPIVKAVTRKRAPLKDKGKIGIRVGKIINKYKVAKHFILNIAEGKFFYSRNAASITQEALLDGVYIIRTGVNKDTADTAKTVSIYKGLSTVERAFRCMKTTDLHIRPVNHHLPERVKSHVFLCMLAYYVEYHMRQALSPIIFQDEEEEKEKARKQRVSIVAKAERSENALYKIATRRSPDGYPIQSFQKILDDLGTLTRNTIAPKENPKLSFKQLAEATPLQKKAFSLLQIKLQSSQ
jgi:transposase